MSPGDWVCYGCLDWGPRLFHPDDGGLKDLMLAAGSVCLVDREDGAFWVLKFGPLEVRVRKELVGGAILPAPAYLWGEPVRVKPPRTERTGIIRCLGWHAKRRRHLYWIEQDGKTVKNRYFAEELESIRA